MWWPLAELLINLEKIQKEQTWCEEMMGGVGTGLKHNLIVHVFCRFKFCARNAIEISPFNPASLYYLSILFPPTPRN